MAVASFQVFLYNKNVVNVSQKHKGGQEDGINGSELLFKSTDAPGNDECNPAG